MFVMFALKRITISVLCLSLASCALIGDFFDATKACASGQQLVTFVEIATEVVQSKCVTEGQLDVLKQDSTIRVINVVPSVAVSNEGK